MAYTIREQILRAVESAIATGYPSEMPAAPQRCRLEPLEDASLPAICWYPVREEIAGVGLPGAPIVRRRLVVRFDCHVCEPPANASYPSIDSRADLLLTFLTSKLAGSRLGGLCHDIRELETTWEFDEGNRERAVVSLSVEILFHTTTNNQAV